MKVMVASLLAVASVACMSIETRMAVAQAPATGGVQLSEKEYAAYNNATTQTTPQTKAPALEAYLTAYPQSPVKTSVLQDLMIAYSSFDPGKTLDAADRLLQVDPENLRALTFEVYFRKAQADQITDTAAKQAPLDQAASFAQKGLAATKPKDMPQADFDAVKANATPIFYSAIGAADLNKKDAAGAIAAYLSELQSVPVAKTQDVGPVLQDTFFLGNAYYASTPPDYVNCTFYATRAASYAPDNFKAQLQPLATYCYKKYHGNTDGYDAVVTAAKANLTPPADFKIAPAPNAADIAHQTVASTADLATLALSDKEFILQNGTPDDADKVFTTIKGKTVDIPDGVVVEATDSVLKLAVSEDSIQSKAADFTFNMKEPLKTVPVVGAKININGTYASYTQSPLMITMSDASVITKKAAAPVRKAPVHRK